MLNFDVRVKNSDAAQPRVTNVKTPIFESEHGISCNCVDLECLLSARIEERTLRIVLSLIV